MHCVSILKPIQGHLALQRIECHCDGLLGILQWNLIGLANRVKRCQKVHRFHKRCQEVRGSTISYQILIKAPLCARKRGKLILPPGFFKTISVWQEVGSKKRKVQENDRNTQQVEGRMLEYFLSAWKNLDIFGSVVRPCWTTLLVGIVERKNF